MTAPEAPEEDDRYWVTIQGWLAVHAACGDSPQTYNDDYRTYSCICGCTYTVWPR